MYIHFLYSVTIYNDSAFYFTEIIMLISWAGTLTQIRKRIGSNTFHACVCVWDGEGRGGAGRGDIMGQYVFFMSKSWTIICILHLITICSDSASYFFEMSILIICVGTQTQMRMGLGCTIFPSIGPRKGHYAFLMSKSRMLIHFQPLIIVLSFQPLIFLKWLCLLDR